MVTRCKATNANGAPCGAQAIRDGWCAWHDPERQAQMTEARRRGGQAKSNRTRARKQLASTAMTPAELQGVIGASIAKVLSGTITPGMGQAVAALARASVSIREATEFDERLEALEAANGLNAQRRA
jgi:hypothetical protein